MSLTALTPTLPLVAAWARRRASDSLLASLMLSGYCGILFFYGLEGSELYRTESLRAIIAQGMLDSGNWIVPRLYGEALFTKPPGMYAAIALCSLPFGQVTDISARLPSAIAASLSVLLFHWYFRRQLGHEGGLAAALLLPMSAMWLDKAPSAEIDMVQVFWVTASILFFLRATEDDTNGPYAWWLASMLCMAGGILTKWTAPEFVYGTALPYLWWRGRLRWLLSWQHLSALAGAAALVFAWLAAAIALEGFDAFWPTVEREAFSRLVPTWDGKPYPWRETLVHPLKLMATTLPWSALALFTLRPGFASHWEPAAQRLLMALHCWTWPQMLFWSLLTEHTARHSFPLFPGLAGLAAMAWLAWSQGKLAWPPWARWRPQPRRVLCAMLVVWLLAKIVFVQRVMPERCRTRHSRENGALLAHLIPPGAQLYLFNLKDEGLLFYFRRPALRVPNPAALPVGEPGYCILCLAEWEAWSATATGRPAEVVRRLHDAQGAPLVLIRI